MKTGVFRRPVRRQFYARRKIFLSTVAVVGAANPKGPLGMPLIGPFGGPI